MVGIAQLVRAPDCGSGGRRFESDYPPHIKEKRLFAFFSYLPEYGSPILARIHLDIGLSPSGKATDFDSVIPLVRIQPAQPRRSKLCIACSDFFVKIRAHTRLSPLVFRKRSHSARLLGCKRPRDGSLSLPLSCGYAPAARLLQVGVHIW